MALTLALELESPSAGSAGAGDDYSHRSHGGCSSSMSIGKRERMFEKVLTPSDVGKLNRLVVPKQFAERHLPLRSAAARSRGTVLCFHDARGGDGTSSTAAAAWRFRYSYWSSSQSYVMTKGWNRYVRDKRLAAGDTVAFCRDGATLFIDCHRRRSPRESSRGTGTVVEPPQQGAVIPTPPAPAVVVPVPAAAIQQQQMKQGLVYFSDKHQHHQKQQEAVVMEEEAAEEEEEAQRQRGRWLRLFGVNLLELRADPVLLDLLQL